MPVEFVVLHDQTLFYLLLGFNLLHGILVKLCI